MDETNDVFPEIKFIFTYVLMFENSYSQQRVTNTPQKITILRPLLDDKCLQKYEIAGQAHSYVHAVVDLQENQFKFVNF